MKTAIVAPVHIQPSERWVDALWNEATRADAHVIIVDDSDGKVTLPWNHDSKGDVYDYAAQKKELGEELYASFERFHHSAACKQFGLWKAWKDGYDAVIVIDSDCIVSEGFISAHLEALEQKGAGWTNPLETSSSEPFGTGKDWYSRGFPYSQRDLPKWAHMGLWEESLDLYGKDRVLNPDKSESFKVSGVFPSPATLPLSGMNVSFRASAVPYMLFLPNFNFRDKKFTRHDDIWGGYLFQKIMREKGGSISFGSPSVIHDTKVNASEDAAAEEPMLDYEDRFLSLVDRALVFSGSGSKHLEAPEIFSWLGREFANSTIFAGLTDAFEFWAKATE